MSALANGEAAQLWPATGGLRVPVENKARAFQGRTGVQKGVYRFKTHEEADAWMTKYALREKDILDRIFLMKWAEENGVKLDPPLRLEAPPNTGFAWLDRLVLWLRRQFGGGKS